MRTLLHIIETVLGIIGAIIENMIMAFFDWLVDTKNKKKDGYFASFTDPKKLLLKKHYGFILDGKRALPDKLSYQNALIVGGTGVGKSSIVLIPSLLSMKGSFVIHDPSGELYEKTAGYLKRKGYDIRTLNFAKAKRSDRFNPLSRAINSADINKVSSMLIRTSLGDGQGDPFWNLLATSLLSITIGIVKRNPMGRQNLREVRHLLGVLSTQPSQFKKRLEEIGNPNLIKEFTTFDGYDRKVKAGVIATVMSALQIFTDEEVAAVTATDTILFHNLRLRKMAIFIQNPVFDQAYFATLTSIFFEQLFGYLLKELPSFDALPVYCLIDEAGILKIPSLDITISNIRKYRAGVLLAIQAVEQLEESYGLRVTRTIMANCFAKLYFTGQTGRIPEEMEKLLGQYEYKDSEGKVKVKPLVTKDELRTMPKNQALLVAGSLPPMKLTLHPYYDNAKLLKKTLVFPPKLQANSHSRYVKNP